MRNAPSETWTPARVQLPDSWAGPPDAVQASDTAASLAVRRVRPRPSHRAEVWASSRACAWALLRTRRVSSWPALVVAARRQALVTSRALVEWRAEHDVRRGGSDAASNSVVVLDHLDHPLIDLVDRSDGWPDRSAILRHVHDVLDRIVADLEERGLAEPIAHQAVDIVVEHPEVRRGAARARQRLIADGFAPVSAAALTALILGYPTRGVPGLVERELRGLIGWGHPSVPQLLDLVVRPRGTRLRGMWTEPSAAASQPAADRIPPGASETESVVRDAPGAQDSALDRRHGEPVAA